MNQGGGGNQTVTQQNIPDWALDYAQNTLDMTKYYTNNSDYRPSTLDRDYSGIRGYNGQGQPNSQVGQFGLNPSPAQQQPGSSVLGKNSTGGWSGGFGGGLLGGFGGGAFGGAFGGPVVPSGFDGAGRPKQPQPMPISIPDIWATPSDFTQGRNAAKYSAPTTGPMATPGGDVNSTAPGGTSSGYSGPTTGPAAVPGGDTNSTAPGGTSSGSSSSSSSSSSNSSSNSSSGNTNNQTTLPAGMSQEEVQALIDEQLQQFDENTITPDEMPTPFPAYDRQRFAAPSTRTTQGENLLANRVSGGNPFAEAQAAARGASNYRSQFTPAALNLQGPRANTYGNVNQGLLAGQYGNANQGLTPAQNYSRDFQQNLAQFQDPYTNQVVDQTIQDLDRARRITNNDISGNAARAGAFGGSREALMRTENNRNFADRTAAAVGQLRSQGFQQAADRAQQEQLQRLGLTASDIQNMRGYQSAGNLQGQNISAQDVRDVRGLRSQGALTAQGLGAQSDRDAMGYQNQLQMQGNQLGVEQARLAEQFRQGAGALNLQGAGALGNLAQMQTADERQRIADLLASGSAGDARNQQDLDFIFNEFQRELGYPGQQIDLRNAAISPATGSIVTTTQPRYEQNPILGGAGAALAAYGMTSNPWIAGGAGLLSLLG